MTFSFRKRGAAPPVPVPLKRWYANIEFVERLRELVEDPVFQLACATLEQQAQPTASIAAMSDRDKASNRMHWLAGYNDFTRDLISLTKFPQEQTTQLSEWDYLTNTQDHE